MTTYIIWGRFFPVEHSLAISRLRIYAHRGQEALGKRGFLEAIDCAFSVFLVNCSMFNGLVHGFIKYQDLPRVE